MPSLQIFGKNNNSLFKNKSKITYSMPQSLKLSGGVWKCACGFDYIAIINEKKKLSILYQNEEYPMDNALQLIDIATSDNQIILLTLEQKLFLWDFNPEILAKGEIKLRTLEVGITQPIIQIQMCDRDVFLLTEDGRVYYLQRNEWYQTKTYSEVEMIKWQKPIIQVSAGENYNGFLTYDGEAFFSPKHHPFNLVPVVTPYRFLQFKVSSYFMGISKRGSLVIWGDSVHGNYQFPTEFSKLGKKFVSLFLAQDNGYALADDGEVWCWGKNQHGELGLSDYEVRKKPFPLITIQNQLVLDVFCGHNYTCCLCQSKGSETIQPMTIKQGKVSSVKTLEGLKIQFGHSPSAEKKRDQDKKRKKSKTLKSFPKGENNEKIKSNQKKKEKDSRSPSQHSHHSRDKKSFDTNKYSSHRSNTQYTFSENEQSWRRKNSTSRNFKNKLSSKQNIEGNKKEKKVSESQSEKIKKIEEEYQKKMSELEQFTMKNTQLENENKILQEKVTQQQQVIQDITQKIRLLQEAIDEHQRGLSTRDNVLEQYQLREKQYKIHIDELQKSIENIIRGKEKRNEITVIYEDLKNNFDKQRQYYMQKIKEYELRIQTAERMQYEQVKSLNKQIQELRRQLERQKQMEEPVDRYHSLRSSPWKPQFGKGQDLPISKVSERRDQWAECSPSDERNVKQMIQRIENNKSRISRSANKLIAMLDISS